MVKFGANSELHMRITIRITMPQWAMGSAGGKRRGMAIYGALQDHKCLDSVLNRGPTETKLRLRLVSGPRLGPI